MGLENQCLWGKLNSFVLVYRILPGLDQVDYLPETRL